MLQGEPDCRSGPPGGTAANGIHDHQHGAAVRSQQAVHILRSSRLFYTVSGQAVLPFDELRQFEANRRHWNRRLSELERELETEPARIRDVYEVRARRIVRSPG